MKKNSFLNFAIIFLLVYLVMNFFFKGNDTNTVVSGDIVLTTGKNEYSQNDLVTVSIKNNTENTIVHLKNQCPNPPLNVLTYQNSSWISADKAAEINCQGLTDYVIPAKGELHLNFNSWNHAIFGQNGRYKIGGDLILETIATTNPTSSTQISTQTTQSQQSTQINTAQISQQTANNTQTIGQTITKHFETNEFEVKPPGLFGQIWTGFFFQPIYNTLIFLTSIVPWNDLGLAIILLTIIIRTILLIPSQRALKSQRKLQEIQPKLAKIREKHNGNQEMIAKETMAIWKEHKVNPFGSCLPLLIQFPVLIALFYVIQSGLNPDNAYLLYGSLKEFSFQKINVNFLGIQNLTTINHFVLPLIVGALQFLQMKLTLVRNEKKKPDQPREKKTAKNEMETANKMMIYIMPVMIALFTAGVPAGVGLYWGVSTIYGIVQQLVVNKQVEEEKAKVRVLPDKSN